ncbi:Alpha-17 giardin [Giardia duodenalis]|uniref:Alpha-17 giardin n=2 Tax=Giardia intestinalis TaxID=5741 RepID=E2RU66_GIAIC|nr:Alpha-17 giardin [Giardia intestinalis]AAX07980.1 alpha-17 giardin [Giardia lamblia ATCC 50803]KAE8304692.1 Alpha-17 giardin [Giardia intestinalis]|eukprot:XP_001705088.1 Alpha-17 giardin [Giardia lamblia ATCC 50803]
MSYTQLSRELHGLVEAGDEVGLAVFTRRFNELQRSEMQIAYQAFRGVDLTSEINKRLKNKAHAELLSSLWKERTTNIVDTLQVLIKRKKKCPRVVLSVVFGSSQNQWEKVSASWTAMYKNDLLTAIKQAIQPSDFVNQLIDKWAAGPRSNNGQLREGAYALKQSLHGEEQPAFANIDDTMDYDKLSTILATTSSTEWPTIVSIYEKLSGVAFDSLHILGSKKSKMAYDTEILHLAAQFARSPAEGVAYALNWAVTDKDLSDICSLTALFVDKAPQTNIRYQKYGVLRDDLIAVLTSKVAAPIVELWAPEA